LSAHKHDVADEALRLIKDFFDLAEISHRIHFEMEETGQLIDGMALSAQR
jgi:hypothetical protein